MAGTRRVPCENCLEPLEVLGRSDVAELVGSPHGFGLLVLIVAAHSDRMMDIVRLQDEVGDRELDLVGPHPGGRFARCEVQLVAKMQEDGGHLADDLPSIVEKRWSE
jgi:hypothetical protein